MHHLSVETSSDYSRHTLIHVNHKAPQEYLPVSAFGDMVPSTTELRLVAIRLAGSGVISLVRRPESEDVEGRDP